MVVVVVAVLLHLFAVHPSRHAVQYAHPSKLVDLPAHQSANVARRQLQRAHQFALAAQHRSFALQFAYALQRPHVVHQCGHALQFASQNARQFVSQSARRFAIHVPLRAAAREARSLVNCLVAYADAAAVANSFQLDAVACTNRDERTAIDNLTCKRASNGPLNFLVFG